MPMFSLPLGLKKKSGDESDGFAAPFTWLLAMHAMILGDSDAGKTWLVLNILLHANSPFLIYYEKIVVIGSEAGDEWHKLAKRRAPDKFLLFEDLDPNIFKAMARRKNKKHWLVIVDDKIKKMKEFEKMVDLYTCRHTKKDSPCCHIWLLIQHYKKVPLGFRKQFKYWLILQSFAADKKLLQAMIDESTLPGTWTLAEVRALAAAATDQPGMSSTRHLIATTYVSYRSR